MWSTQTLWGCVRLCPAPQRPSYTCVQTTLCTHSLARTNKRGCPALPGCSGWARKLGAPAASSNKTCLFPACWLVDCAAAMSIGRVHTNFRMSETLIFIHFFWYHLNHTLQHYSPVETVCAHWRNRATRPVAATPQLTTACTLVAGRRT
jgi:hypothetical protein